MANAHFVGFARAEIHNAALQCGSLWEGETVSIVRVGLAETKKFADGYDAIFGKKKTEEEKQEKQEKPKAKDADKKSGKKK